MNDAVAKDGEGPSQFSGDNGRVLAAPGTAYSAARARSAQAVPAPRPTVVRGDPFHAYDCDHLGVCARLEHRLLPCFVVQWAKSCVTTWPVAFTIVTRLTPLARGWAQLDFFAPMLAEGGTPGDDCVHWLLREVGHKAPETGAITKPFNPKIESTGDIGITTIKLCSSQKQVS